jgi:hypothetical protein
MTLLLGVFLFVLAMFAIATICRHRIVIIRQSAPESDIRQQEFLIQNVEDVPLNFAIEIEVSITGGGNFESAPVLFCGYREFACGKTGEQLRDEFNSDRSFSFYLPRIRALNAWVVNCKTRGGAVVILSVFGYDAEHRVRTTYFPAIPRRLLARDIGTKRTMPSAPSLALRIALMASALAYCLSWWFPPFWTSIHPVMRPVLLLGTQISAMRLWSTGLLAILMLIVFWCFRSVRQQPEPFIQPYLGRGANLGENVLLKDRMSDVSGPS